MSMLTSILKATDMESTLATATIMVDMGMDTPMKRSMAIGTKLNTRPLLCMIDLLDLNPNIDNTRPRSLVMFKLKLLRSNPSTRKPINLKKRQS